MSRTAEYAFLACAQGVDMSRTAQVRGPRGWVGQRADRRRTVVDRDARGAVVAQQIDGHCKGSPQQRGVVLLHHVEAEFGAAVLRKRCAEYAAALLEHEIHDFGGYFLRRYDEVAFVFAVFVIDDDHYFAVAEIFDNLFHTIQNRAFCHFV